MAHLLRRKSQVLIAHGACAQLGGIPSLANQFELEQLLKTVYEDLPTVQNPESARPQPEHHINGHTTTLPVLHNVTRALDQVVDVDYYLPGCSTPPGLIAEAIGVLLSGKLPPIGAVLAPDIALCETCERKETKPVDLAFTEFKRPHLHALDNDTCLLAQGVVCMGPATRSGCEAACIAGNMPCTGCMGPTSRVRDHGAKMLSSLSSNIAAEEEPGIEATLAGIPDPVGTFYRYGLAASLLRRRTDLGQS
jgi:F420-non-reducing hydrogenase small subunit